MALRALRHTKKAGSGKGIAMHAEGHPLRLMKCLVVSGMVLSGLLVGCAGSALTRPSDEAATAVLERTIAGAHRTPAYTARDRYRHPKETLLFFGFKPELQIVEIWPGGGWYTEILAPALNDHGRYTAAHYHPDDKSRPYRPTLRQRFLAKLAAQPERYGRVVVTELDPPQHVAIAPQGSADLVLTFRNVHNWTKAGTDQAMFRAFYAALKAGGILGVVEHRARAGTSFETMKRSGYMTEDYVIRLAEAAGFRLDARSAINANPRDTTDHPEGVWTLPPTLRLKAVDRAKYLAIGESDRMTLRFVKP